MKRISAWIVAGMLSVLAVGPARAGEVDVLVDKLVEKGYLSPVEAQIVRDETAQTVAAEVAKGESYAVPSWVQNMTLKGDVRVRYQYERDQTDTEARERGRVRYRLGLENQVGDVTAGGGIASGGEDPRSTNQTFSDTFETGDLRLDYAYARYQPSYAKGLDLIAGKFPRKEYLWAPTDMLWDGDINPSGASLHAQGSIGSDTGIALIDNSEYLFNTGVWVMDENSHSDMGAPFLYYTQAGISYKEEKVDALAAGTYYAFNNVQGACLQWTAGSNTGVSAGSDGACSGALAYDYDSLGLSTEFGVKKLFGGLPWNIDERIAVFGDYVQNVSAGVSDQDAGWAMGVKFGYKKVKDPGSWQLKFQHVVLQRDAFLDTFPDSDRLGGKTNVKSNEVILEYALKKNVILGLDYYQNDKYKGSEDLDHLVQVDLLVKF